MIGSKQTGFVIDSAEGPLFLISDIHAGALSPSEDEDTKKKLEILLQHVDRSEGRLIILGDLFDYWQESGLKTPKQLHSWLDIFDSHRSSSKPTVLITGNHDHWAGSALSNLGMIVVRDHVMLATIDRPWLLLHGDGLPSNELKLVRKGLNKRFRNSCYNAFFNVLPLCVRVLIMRTFSNYRKKRGHDSDDNQFIDAHLRKWLTLHDFAGVVYGHTHSKMMQNINGKYLINTGTFYSDGTVMIIDGATLKMTTVDDLKSTESAKMTYITHDGTRR